MPYRSEAQCRYFNANQAKLESEGVDVDHWNESSKGKDLPAKVEKEASDALSMLRRQAAQLLEQTNEKAARHLGLGNVPTGTGPQQMYSALNMLNQAKALVDPTETLEKHRLARGDFEGMVDELAADGGDTYDFDAYRKDLKEESIIKGLIGAGLGGLVGSLGGVGGGLAGATMGGLAGAGYGHLAAGSHNKRAALPLLKESAEDKLKKKKDSPSKKKKDSPSKKILNMDSTGGRLADYLVPGAWGGERAGRAQAMADAIGEKTTFGVRHPWLQSNAHTLLGGGLGALLGSGAGWALAQLFNPPETRNATTLGALLGGSAGVLGGTYTAGKSRRNEMKRIGHFYDQDVAEGKVNPKNPKMSLLSALLLPGRGPHRTGQVEAVKAMRGEKTMPEMHDESRDVLYSARMLPYVGLPISLLHNYGQNIKTQLNSESKAEEPKIFQRNPVIKAASDVALLARASARQASMEEKESSDGALDWAYTSGNVPEYQFRTLSTTGKSLIDSVKGIPEAVRDELRKAKGQYAGTLIGGRAGAGALAGGLAGGVMGLADDPGYDERTGKRKSRLMKALKMGLGGAALGGVANTYLPQGEQYGGQLGGELGRFLASNVN